MYEVVIIGGGPAGVAAAVYTVRKKLKTLVITESFGGQSIVSDDIQNWIGESHISGLDLAKKLEAHLRSFKDVEIISSEKVMKIQEIDCSEDRICDFQVETEQGNTYTTKSLILTMGARRRRLGIPGEDEFDGKGVAFCSTCDAPIFSGKKVAVVGGGNAGLEAALDLVPYATHITILQFGEELKGDPITQDHIKKSDTIEVLYNVETIRIVGDKVVKGLECKNTKTGEQISLDVQGVFVEIGSVPNTEMVKDLVELDKWGQIQMDMKHATTSHPGIFAAGDITEDPYKQNNISAGDGVRAALSSYQYLQKIKKQSPATEPEQ